MNTATTPTTQDSNNPSSTVNSDDPRLVNTPRVVATIAALRALPPPVPGVDSGYAIVEGYYEPGDGGGGNFRWDAAANGRITEIRGCTAVQFGTGYPQSGVTITLSPPDQSGGVQATVTCDVHPPSGGVYNYNGIDATGGLYNFVITNPGSGYLHEPTLTLSADAPSQWQRAVLHPYSPDFEDGGCTLASSYVDGQGQPTLVGRWKRVLDDPHFIDARWFGVILDNEAEADNNSARITAAREALPLYLFGSSGVATAGQVQCEGLVFARNGVLRLPQGNVYIGDTVSITPGMTLSSGEGFATLSAKTGFAPSSAPKRMLRILKNGLYNAYGYAPYPGPPYFSPADTYNAKIEGRIELNGRRDTNPDTGEARNTPNAGVQGAELLAAQGCYVRGELACLECNEGGQIHTSIPADILTVLAGAAPGVIVENSVNALFGKIDAEHISRTNKTDQDGDPVPAVLIVVGQGNRIEVLSSEGNALACKIDASPGSSIGSYDGNVDISGVIIQNAAAGVRIDNIAQLNPAPGATFALLDRSPNTTNSGTTRLNSPVTLPFLNNNNASISYRVGQNLPYVFGDVQVSGRLVTNVSPTAQTVSQLFNPVPAHTGLLVVGDNTISASEMFARTSLHLQPNNANNHVYHGGRATGTAMEHVWGWQDGSGNDHELAVLGGPGEGFILKDGTFQGNGSGLTNLNLSNPVAIPTIVGNSSVEGVLSSSALSAAGPLPDWVNPMPVHTGLAIRGNSVFSDTEYTARESLHHGSDTNPQVFTALRTSPSRGLERVFGRRDGGGNETEDALLNAQGFTLKNGALNAPKVVTPSSTNDNNAQFGNLGVQSYAVNNGWVSDNVYYNGQSFTAAATGYATLAYFFKGAFQIVGNNQGVPLNAGSQMANPRVRFRTNPDGTFGIGNLLVPQDDTLNVGGFDLSGDGLGNVKIKSTASVGQGITLIPSTLPTPAAGYNGRLWYDGAHFYGCNGTAWRQLDNP